MIKPLLLLMVRMFVRFLVKRLAIYFAQFLPLLDSRGFIMKNFSMIYWKVKKLFQLHFQGGIILPSFFTCLSQGFLKLVKFVVLN